MGKHHEVGSTMMEFNKFLCFRRVCQECFVSCGVAENLAQGHFLRAMPEGCSNPAIRVTKEENRFNKLKRREEAMQAWTAAGKKGKCPMSDKALAKRAQRLEQIEAWVKRGKIGEKPGEKRMAKMRDKRLRRDWKEEKLYKGCTQPKRASRFSTLPVVSKAASIVKQVCWCLPHSCRDGFWMLQKLFTRFLPNSFYL